MGDVAVVLTLLVAVVALAALADRLRVPYPILLVIGGIGLGFVPRLPNIQLPPDVIFLLFIPPLVYAASFFTSWRDFVANARPIGLLGIGLVVSTAVLVAVVAHSVVGGIGWAPAFVLGAVVSNTDTTAVMAIAERTRLPRRLTTVLEGESLINDAVALTAFRLSVIATVSGAFSVWDIGGRFALAVLVAVPVGLAAGWCGVAARSRMTNPRLIIILGLLSPYAAYLPADKLEGSGILAVVIAGLYVGRREARIESAQTRLQAQAFWDFFVFLLNGLLFILVGLQLRPIWNALPSHHLGHLFWSGAVISLTVILCRCGWIALTIFMPHLLGSRQRSDFTGAKLRGLAVIAWGGLRGGDTLAAALAIPLVTDTGAAFPSRPMVLFLAIVVIVVTLVGQGLTLPVLIHRLNLQDDGAERQEEALARRTAATAALTRLDLLAEESTGYEGLIAKLRQHYAHEAALLAKLEGASDLALQKVQRRQQIELQVITAMHESLLQLRDDNAISDGVLRRVERELDLEAARFDTEVG